MSEGYDFAAEHRLAMGKPMSMDAASGMDQETKAAFSEIMADRFCKHGRAREVIGCADCSREEAQKILHTLPLSVMDEAMAPMIKRIASIMERNGLLPPSGDAALGFTPMSGTESKPLALSRDTRHYGPEIPVTAFKRWER